MGRSSRWILIGAFTSTFILSGCAHVGTRSGAESPNSTAQNGTVKRVDNFKVEQSQPVEIVYRGIKLANTRLDLPVTYNSRVEFWIDYFTGRGRGNFEKYLERSEFFIPYIQPILKENGMPEDLVYLAMIESGFNNHARSFAKAVGPWQFISATGKRYGLMVNWWVDERRDTRKSTIAAINYLKDLYTMFQSWELAASSYNAGEAKVARAIRRYGTKDFWVIARQRYLRQETRDYFPKILAAALVSKNRTQFGFEPEKTVSPHEGEAVSGSGEIVKLEKEKEGDVVASGAASPSPAPGSQPLTLVDVLQANGIEDPDAYESAASEEVSAPPTQPKIEPKENIQAKVVATPTVGKNGRLSGEMLAEFEVESPADLLKVARAAGLSYQTVKALNPELTRWCTPASVATYRIKLPASVKEHFLQVYNHPAYPRKVQFLTYKIRKGEAISHVSRRFGIKVDPIADLNGVSPRAPLRVGTNIMLPIPTDRTRSLASLEVLDPPERRSAVRRGKKKRRPAYSDASQGIHRVSYKKRAAARR